MEREQSVSDFKLWFIQFLKHFRFLFKFIIQINKQSRRSSCRLVQSACKIYSSCIKFDIDVYISVCNIEFRCFVNEKSEKCRKNISYQVFGYLVIFHWDSFKHEFRTYRVHIHKLSLKFTLFQKDPKQFCLFKKKHQWSFELTWIFDSFWNGPFWMCWETNDEYLPFLDVFHNNSTFKIGI